MIFLPNTFLNSCNKKRGLNDLFLIILLSVFEKVGTLSATFRFQMAEIMVGVDYFKTTPRVKRHHSRLQAKV